MSIGATSHEKTPLKTLPLKELAMINSAATGAAADTAYDQACVDLDTATASVISALSLTTHGDALWSAYSRAALRLVAAHNERAALRLATDHWVREHRGTRAEDSGSL